MSVCGRSFVGDVVWKEPVRGDLFPREYLGLSGIEQLRLFLSGNVGDPPISRLTGMHLTEVGIGERDVRDADQRLVAVAAGDHDRRRGRDLG